MFFLNEKDLICIRMVFMWAYGKFLKNGNLLNKKNKELELLLQKLKLFSLKDRGRKLYSTPLVMRKSSTNLMKI